MSKGDTPRPVNREKFNANYDRIFGPAEREDQDHGSHQGGSSGESPSSDGENSSTSQVLEVERGQFGGVKDSTKGKPRDAGSTPATSTNKDFNRKWSQWVDDNAEALAELETNVTKEPSAE